MKNIFGLWLIWGFVFLAPVGRLAVRAEPLEGLSSVDDLSALLAPGHQSAFEIGSIVELRRLIEVIQKKGTKNRILFVFDNDETLTTLGSRVSDSSGGRILNRQTFGTDPWFRWRRNAILSAMKQQANPLPTAEMEAKATLEAIREWEAVQRVSSAVALEPQTAEVINEIQNANIPNMVLTARPPSLAETTLHQLAISGISFGGNRNHLMVDYGQHFIPDDTLFREGIFFVGPSRNKGDELKRWLDQRNIPVTVIFVDDRRGHIDSMRNALASKNSNEAPRYGLIALRIGTSDPHVTILDNPSHQGYQHLKETVKLQRLVFERLSTVIPDPLAHMILASPDCMRLLSTVGQAVRFH